MADLTLDLRGLKCPLPIMRAAKALPNVPLHGALEILANDPISAQDFPDFCAATGNALVEATQEDGVFRFLIRRDR
jgi:tRNA 2-thiouridine synthesizing protein A